MHEERGIPKKNTKFTCCLERFGAQQLLDFVCLFVYFAGESHNLTSSYGLWIKYGKILFT